MDKEEAIKNHLQFQVRNKLEENFNINIDARVSRYLELDYLNYIKVVPNTHFASITVECMQLYGDGYFFACISLCQAINEALVRYICDRKGIRINGFINKVNKLEENSNKVPLEWIGIFRNISKDRDDYHHLNPNVPVQRHKLQTIAKEKIASLLDVEGESSNLNG